MVKRINVFSPKDRVSKTYIPRAVLTAKPMGYTKYCNMRFGSYGQTTHKTNQNTKMTRTLGVVHLRTLDILHSVFEVINLLTGDIISCHKVNTLLMELKLLPKIWSSITAEVQIL